MQNRTGHLQIMRMENKKGDNKVRLYFHLRGRPRRVERERERAEKERWRTTFPSFIHSSGH